MIIDIGEVCDLHIPTMADPPLYDIYLGRRRRPDPGPPTTAALSKALKEWASSGHNAEEDVLSSHFLGR